MNYVKKLFKEKLDFIILILFILSVTITLIIFQIRNTEKIYFLTIPDNYSVITNEKNLLSLNIKCSRNDTMYLNKEMVDSVYFFDYITKDTYQILLENIEYLNRYSYEQDSYFNYRLTFRIPFKADTEIELNNFYLTINYLNDESVSFKMGSLSILSTDQDRNNILIKNLKGIVNTYNDLEYLVGVIFNFEGLVNSIELINIQAISPIVTLDLDEVILLDDIELANSTNIVEILGKDYDPFENKDLEGDLSIDLEKEKAIFIPLNYNRNVQIKTLGFLIEYLENGEFYQQLVYPFQFFNTNSESIVEKIEYDYN